MPIYNIRHRKQPGSVVRVVIDPGQWTVSSTRWEAGRDPKTRNEEGGDQSNFEELVAETLRKAATLVESSGWYLEGEDFVFEMPSAWHSPWVPLDFVTQDLEAQLDDNQASVFRFRDGTEVMASISEYGVEFVYVMEETLFYLPVHKEQYTTIADRLPHITQTLRMMFPVGTVLVGTLVADSGDKEDPGFVREILSLQDIGVSLHRQLGRMPIRLYIKDLIALDGDRLDNLPWVTRMGMLESILGNEVYRPTWDTRPCQMSGALQLPEYIPSHVFMGTDLRQVPDHHYGRHPDDGHSMCALRYLMRLYGWGAGLVVVSNAHTWDLLFDRGHMRQVPYAGRIRKSDYVLLVVDIEADQEGTYAVEVRDGEYVPMEEVGSIDPEDCVVGRYSLYTVDDGGILHPVREVNQVLLDLPTADDEYPLLVRCYLQDRTKASLFGSICAAEVEDQIGASQCMVALPSDVWHWLR